MRDTLTPEERALIDAFPRRKVKVCPPRTFSEQPPTYGRWKVPAGAGSTPGQRIARKAEQAATFKLIGELHRQGWSPKEIALKTGRALGGVRADIRSHEVMGRMR